MHESSGPGSSSEACDPLEELVAALLEAPAAERAELLARLEREDAARAQRVRARLGALGELGMAVDAPPRAAEWPERFGSFVRLERVGAGGMGEVHRARDEASGELAALKLLRPDHLWFESARARFRREIEACAQLSHAGIVRVLDVGEERGVPWLAMEWVGGASLEQVLERLRGVPPESLGALDFERAVRAASAERAEAEAARDGAFPGRSYVEVVTRVVARVAAALAHAHEAGVLHRDVKPSNVLVTPAGRVLLADFGLALPRGADRMTRTGNWLGSLPYAAPEQIEGSPRELDARADVYSLGATLYELVTLRTPFLGGPESVVRRRIATGDLEPPRRLNPALARSVEKICLAALDLDPRRRIASARALAEEFERALAGQPVRLSTTPPWLRVRRWTRRRPALALTAGAAGLAVLGSLAIALRENALAARLTRLADAELVRGLLVEAQGFWPAAPRHLDGMTDWLVRAEELLARRPDHQRSFDELTAHALAYDPRDRERDQAATREDLVTLAQEVESLTVYVARGDRLAPPVPPAPEEVRASERAARARLVADPEELLTTLRASVTALRRRMEADAAVWGPDLEQLEDFDRILDRSALELDQRLTFRFADPLDAWRHDALRLLLADLGELDGVVRRVRALRARTEELAGICRGSGAAAWEEARTAIAASACYGGLALEPIFGLLPLGEDPHSHLWEFLFLASGAAPARDESRPGCWRMEDASGVVLVLLPGGRFLMGAAPGEETPSSSLPRHAVELAPFFLSRYELSVAQAERLGGFPPEKLRPADGRLPLTLDWERAGATLHQHGLELPTEAQWEYAARAGAADLSLGGHANVFDRSRLALLRREGASQEGTPADLDDGFPELAPIGSFAPNAFGLHDVLGNVSEWCRDRYVARGYATLVPRAGDGLRATVVSAQTCAVRGGSYCDSVELCQPAFRTHEAPGKMTYSIGVRPVRSLAPD